MSKPTKNKAKADESAYPGDDYWRAVDKDGAVDPEGEAKDLKTNVTSDDEETKNKAPTDNSDTSKQSDENKR